MARITAMVMVLMLYCSFINLIDHSSGMNLKIRTNVSWAHASFIGEISGDVSGIYIARAGDVNGDGYDDLLIGASQANNWAGKTYLVLGKPSEWKINTDISNADASFIGEYPTTTPELSLSAAGDVNGDGFDDFLIGVGYRSTKGETYLIFGRATGWAMNTSLSKANASFIGENNDDHAGYSVSSAGDINDDGFDDIIIGAYGNNEHGTLSGQVYLIFGKKTGWSMDTPLSSASASYLGEDGYDELGKCVSEAGDVNNDGYDDFLMGAPERTTGVNGNGKTYLILGKASGWKMDMNLTLSFDASWFGERSFDRLGESLDCAGDVNNDGFNDFLIGAKFNNEGGAGGQTYLIFGKKSGWASISSLNNGASFWGEGAFDWLGSSLSGAGDVNGDGYDDFLIGSYKNEYGGNTAGQTYLILGKATGWTMDTRLSTASASFFGHPNENSAFSLSGAGDVNGDHYDDFVIGACGNDEGGSDAGKTYLFLGGVGPPAPANFKAKLAQNQVHVTLSWDTPSSWGEPLVRYRIYRSVDNMDFDYLGDVSPTSKSYVDSYVVPGLTYHYKVCADYDQGEQYFGTSFISILCDKDTDQDGVGNIVDDDDDGDGYPDQSDVFPCNSTEWLDTDWDGIGNTKDTDDDNDGIVDSLDAEPMNPLNGLRLDLSYLNESFALSHEELSDMMEEIETSIGEINDSILDRIEKLDQRITSQIYQLNLLIKSVNSSISSQIVSLNQDLVSFKSDMDSQFLELAGFMNDSSAETENRLTEMQKVIQDISPAIQGVNVSILDKIENGLGMIKTDLLNISEGVEEGDEEIAHLIDGMIVRIEGYRNDTTERLDNITALMATKKTLDDLYQKANSLERDLETLNDLQKGVGEIKKEQEGTSSGLSFTTILVIAAIVLEIVLILLVVMLLRRKGSTVQNEPKVEAVTNTQGSTGN